MAGRAAALRRRACALRRPSTALLVLGGGALCAWEGTVARSTVASRASVATVIAVVVGAALVAGRGRQRKTSGRWVREAVDALRGAPPARPAVRAAAAAWALLIALTVAWDLASFARQAHWLPTLSRLAGDVTRHEWGRGAVVAVWLLLGCYLALGSRLVGRARPPTPEDHPAGLPGAPGQRTPL